MILTDFVPPAIIVTEKQNKIKKNQWYVSK
nr:MAG TPA: hypothetical protein [Caudoviricetes sp.]